MFKFLKKHRLPKLIVKVDTIKHKVVMWEKGDRKHAMNFYCYDSQPLEEMMVEFYAEKRKTLERKIKRDEYNAVKSIKVNPDAMPEWKGA